jgi:hypothetical protein
LEIKAQADLKGVRPGLGKQAVEVSAAEADAVAVGIPCYSGAEEEIDVLDGLCRRVLKVEFLVCQVNLVDAACRRQLVIRAGRVDLLPGIEQVANDAAGFYFPG